MHHHISHQTKMENTMPLATPMRWVMHLAVPRRWVEVQ